LKLKIDMLRTQHDTLRKQGGNVVPTSEQLEKALAKKKNVGKQINREKVRCHREFLRRRSLGFKRVFDQFDTEFFDENS
jgi:hypothetical protein